jgi:hypothetical protein
MDVLTSRARQARMSALAGGIVAVAIACSAGAALAKRANDLTPSPAGAEVYFVELKDGAVVPEKFKIFFGLRNMGVAPAGSDTPNTGHHHLIVDSPLPALNQPIPNDFQHLHFGAAQTEAEITLSPGKHTLQLVMGDKAHIPHSPPVMSQRITVNVVPKGGPTASAPGAALYFADLKDGANVPSKLTIHFGLRNMGVAPAGSDRPNSGHHHVLIDTDLPALDQPIPNDFNHLHFGAGQTQATVDLTPGEHTLQLLFGDKDHIPHNPPLFSEKIKVRVAEPVARTPSPADAKVYFVGIKDGDKVAPNVTIHFGLVNMGVAPAGLANPNTGHHHLIIDAELATLDQPIPNDFKHLHFGAGQTEAPVTLPLGRHRLQLVLGDANHVPHDPPVMSQPIYVTVTKDGK